MCNRPAIHIDVHVDEDDDHRPILCGQIISWAKGATGTLLAGQVVQETIAVDGWTLAQFATRIYNLVHPPT